VTTLSAIVQEPVVRHPATPAALPPRSGYRGRAARAGGRLLDRALDARQALRRDGSRLDRLAAGGPPRQIALIAVYAPGGAGTLAGALAELRRTRHSLEVALGSLGEPGPALAAETVANGMAAGGKLANVNAVTASLPAIDGADWVMLLDDDVVLPTGFLDRLVALAERFGLDLVQPALTWTSHTAFPVVRRRAALLRQTRFVEIGPAVMLSRRAFAELHPFPEGGMGWGVDLHWAAVAARLGWRLGVADAVPVRHDLRPTAAGYDTEAAREGAARLLATREHIGWRQADEVVETHRRLRA
jgi:hypothetical protein